MASKIKIKGIKKKKKILMESKNIKLNQGSLKNNLKK